MYGSTYVLKLTETKSKKNNFFYFLILETVSREFLTYSIRLPLWDNCAEVYSGGFDWGNKRVEQDGPYSWHDTGSVLWTMHWEIIFHFFLVLTIWQSRKVQIFLKWQHNPTDFVPPIMIYFIKNNPSLEWIFETDCAKNR